ncbi:GNAT family N-acetyltransferase [Streptosporangium sandarakinum]|uniref:GNAT family N-acetyltransferase n=1 Tax=Streptosporangium sandarakinum TaxID=1260955 RepID=UPI00343E2EF2
MSASLTVEISTSIETVDTAEWDEVVSRSGAPVFYRSRYLRAYERFPLIAIEAFFYFVVRAGGRAVTVLPVTLLRGLDPLGQLRVRYPLSGDETGLLSHVWHCYDAWVPGEPNLEAVTGAMRELAGERGAAWYGFVNVPRGSALGEGLVSLGFPARHIEDRFRVDLRPFGDVADYVASANPRGRANMRRNGRRAGDAGARGASLPLEEADLAEIGELCQRTAARHGTGSFYPQEVFAGFLTELGDAAHVIEVRERGRLVGVAVCLRDESRFHAWACGVDYEVGGNYSPYPLLYPLSVGQALREGLTTLEGGRGNHVFKLRHGLTPLPLDACLLPVR